LALLEEITDAAGADTDEHFNDSNRKSRRKETPGLTGEACQESYCGAWRTANNTPFGNFFGQQL